MITKSEYLQDRQNISDFLRQHTQFIVDPIVAVMAELGIRPNMLTYFGLLVHIPVAFFLAQGQWTIAALLALFGFVDAFDGSLARKLGIAEQNKFGAFLDSTTDRIAEILLYGGFITYFSYQADALYATITAIALGGSLMVSYTRARAEALGLHCEVGIFSRIVRYGIFFFLTLVGLPEIALIILAVGTWITTGQRIHHVWHQASDAAE